MGAPEALPVGCRVPSPEAGPNPTAGTCIHCGEPEVAELLEVWSPREFSIQTCCEGMHEAVSEFLADDPKAAARWLNTKGLDGISARGARRIIDDSGHLLIDWHVDIRSIELKQAKELVSGHHRHCAQPPAGWRFGAGIYNGPELIGAVMVGRPVARGFDPLKVVEVNRLVLRDDIPPDLRWNACSMSYSWAAKQAKQRGFQKAITYTLESEAGTSLRAAGWTPEAVIKGRSWNTRSRPRQDRMEIVNKQRWSKDLTGR